MQSSTPRGIRNNNPGNIDHVAKNSWLGLDKNNPSDGRFCRFISPVYGIRALAKLLRNYGNKSGEKGVGGPGIDTVQEVINRWAPPKENNTGSYVNSVAKKLGVSAQQSIDLNHEPTLIMLCEAIIQHENGQQPYELGLLAEGVRMALR
ncbi:structural protein [Plesiomonas shigelloides]|uniref:structural protein n=1 Tax=Plesiomonas shigelloides TaxID=703 RepID=UPI00267548BA|nr:structural protein [Plesiomonas shigelloides]